MSTKQQYIHNDGWKDPSQPLHTQHWVMSAMKAFHNKQKKWQHKLCSICHELWPTLVSGTEHPYICTRCKKDKNDTKLFSAENDMDPGSVPSCLQNLSQVEEMLIARACPIITIYRKHGGQRRYKGHVVKGVQHHFFNMPQNISLKSTSYTDHCGTPAF